MLASFHLLQSNSNLPATAVHKLCFGSPHLSGGPAHSSLPVKNSNTHNSTVHIREALVPRVVLGPSLLNDSDICTFPSMLKRVTSMSCRLYSFIAQLSQVRTCSRVHVSGSADQKQKKDLYLSNNSILPQLLRTSHWTRIFSASSRSILYDEKLSNKPRPFWRMFARGRSCLCVGLPK